MRNNADFKKYYEGKKVAKELTQGRQYKFLEPIFTEDKQSLGQQLLSYYTPTNLKRSWIWWRPIGWIIIIATMLLPSFVLPSSALTLDEDTRTVAVNVKGDKVVLTLEQVKRGKRLFNNACATCHVGGLTKTNPNVGLDAEALGLATPPRDNILSLVAYMKDPTTYDGVDSISELHPSIKSADIFTKMLSLTDSDLFAMAGHILIQPKIVNEKWGGGKIYY
jgi:photosystem II cytochrome c550